MWVTSLKQWYSVDGRVGQTISTHYIADWLLYLDLKKCKQFSLVIRLDILNPAVSEMVIGADGRYRIIAGFIL